MSEPFGLFLFASAPALVRDATAAGIDGIVIDWERIGKGRRQSGADTQIGTDTIEDLVRARAATKARILCRANPFHEGTEREIGDAAAAGADEVLLPMVRTAEEVERALEFARGRVGLGILIETVHAIEAADALGRLPIARAYLGLNDLSIERRTSTIFAPLGDGTLDRLRPLLSRVPFGFGGLTIPERGDPIPCRLLIAEMTRLRCDFSFLRRSFLRDTGGRQLAPALKAIREAIEAARARPRRLVEGERESLLALLRADGPGTTGASGPATRGGTPEGATP